MGIQLRDMTPDDYDSAYALWASCGLHLGESDSREGIARLLAHNPGLCFIAVVDGKIVGNVLGTYDGRRGWVHHLAVAEEYRERGIGRALMLRLEQEFRNRGVIQANLFVTDDNLAVIAFYEKLGWYARSGAVGMSRKFGDEAMSGDQSCAC